MAGDVLRMRGDMDEPGEFPKAKVTLNDGLPRRRVSHRLEITAILVVLSLCVVTYVLVFMPLKTKEQSYDEVSGSYRYRTIWLSKYASAWVVHTSAFEKRLCEIGYSWPQSWSASYEETRSLIGNRLDSR